MAKAKAELQLSPGDLYEDCSFHPVVCVEVDYDRDEIFGISLIAAATCGAAASVFAVYAS